MGYEEQDATVVSALHIENSNDRVVPLLWDFSLASDESDKSAELQEDGPVLLNSDFQQFWTRIAVQPPCVRICLSLPSLVWQPPPRWARSRGNPRRVTAGASLRYWGQACRILRSAASRNILPISCDYVLYLAEVSLPRHGCSAVQSSTSPPPASIQYFGRIPVVLRCTTSPPTQRRGARRNKRLLQFIFSSASYMHA